MDTIIFLPGGGGSILELDGGQVWPPTLWEFLTHYGRMQQLQNPAVKATEIVNSIPPNQLIAVPVYRPILEDLYAISTAKNVSFIPLPFDFRKSVFNSAKVLKAQIQKCCSNGATSITLVCHSTGNQVARALLENVTWQKQPWFSSVGRYVGVCGPHFGVPEVLEYGLGLSDWLSITAADMKKFSQDVDYPGMYQLLPYKGRPVLIDVNTGAQDIYDTNVANTFGLSLKNLGAARKLQKVLDNFSKKPNGVQYVIVAAYGQQTDETI